MWKLENKTICDGKCKHARIDTEKVIVMKEVMKVIRTLIAELPNLEWMCMLQGIKEGDTYLVNGITIPEQEVTSSHVEFTSEGDKQAQETRNIGWIHSHNNMGAFLSNDDMSTASQNEITIVINNKFETKSVVTKKLPCGEKAIVDIMLIMEQEADEETIEIIKRNIKEKKYVQTNNFRTITDYTNKEFSNSERPKGMSKKEFKRRKREQEAILKEHGIQTSNYYTDMIQVCQWCKCDILEYQEALETEAGIMHTKCYVEYNQYKKQGFAEVDFYDGKILN